MKISNRTGKVLTLCAALVLFQTFVAAANDPVGRPNVIIILADDLGCGDMSLYDGWIKTPRIDQMAAEGVRFTDFHSNSSVCSPTRAALLTGRYQQRVGIIDVIAGHLDTHCLVNGTLAGNRDIIRSTMVSTSLSDFSLAHAIFIAIAVGWMVLKSRSKRGILLTL
jgi:hypothetical protein